MNNAPGVLVVGDHFIPGEFYLRALDDLAHGLLGRVTTVDLGGSKKRQHQDQQVMEARGPNTVNLEPGLVEAMRDHELLIVHFAPVPKEVFASGARTRAVFTARTGVENVDVSAATEAGTPIFNVHGRNASAVAELALGLMLAEARNIARADRSIKDGGWRKDFPNTPVEVGGSTVGLVGYGHVGRELAQRLKGFGSRLLIFDPYVEPTVVEADGGELSDIETLFAESDFVSIQARLTDETEELVDARLIKKMKPTAFLINVGRSRLVKTADLLEALEAGRIAGAGLDVFDEEPLPADSRFRRLDNVTLTTHFGGDTTTTNRRSATLVAERVKTFIETADLSNAVNASDLTG